MSHLAVAGTTMVFVTIVLMAPSAWNYITGLQSFWFIVIDTTAPLNLKSWVGPEEGLKPLIIAVPATLMSLSINNWPWSITYKHHHRILTFEEWGCFLILKFIILLGLFNLDCLVPKIWKMVLESENLFFVFLFFGDGYFLFLKTVLLLIPLFCIFIILDKCF